MEKMICDLIIAAGVPVNSRGYWYIREAILLALEDQEALLSVTKALYPRIALRFNTSPGGVEKGIRDAICKSWSTGNIPESIRSLCERRPTNSQYMTYFYEYFLHMLGEKKERVKSNKLT